MNIQIFGTKKCNDTKKAEHFFKERGIKYQFIDMKEKGMSKGEFILHEIRPLENRESAGYTAGYDAVCRAGYNGKA